MPPNTVKNRVVIGQSSFLQNEEVIGESLLERKEETVTPGGSTNTKSTENIINNQCAVVDNNSFSQIEEVTEESFLEREDKNSTTDSLSYSNSIDDDNGSSRETKLNLHDDPYCFKDFLPASEKSMRTFNPIRAIIDPIFRNSIQFGKEREDGKNQISLALGDPTAHGNFAHCPAIINAMINALQSPTAAAGYVNACGTDEARSSIAEFYSEEELNLKIKPDQVIVANGCSGALEIALTSLLDEDTFLLIPRPAFPLYEVIAKSHGANVAHYNLQPENGWECDLDNLERLICKVSRASSKVRPIRGIVINNPGNPTGSVFLETHLIDLLNISKKYQIPIISDEIYGDLTFGNTKFHPILHVASRSKIHAPLIVVSGIGKQFLVPGWRVGWSVFYDEGTNDSLKNVKMGARQLAQVILGASHIAQCAVPAALNKKDDSVLFWKQALRCQLEEQAMLVTKCLESCHGLSLLTIPQGAMYCMVRIHMEIFQTSYKSSITDDLSFTKKLLEEENLVVLPGQAFGLDSTSGSFFFRIVFCAPKETLSIACERLVQFCQRHTRK